MSREKYPFTLEDMADSFGMLKSPFGNGKLFSFGKESQDGWFSQFEGSEGLFVSSMWFTPRKGISFTVDTKVPFFLLFSIDCGDVTITEKGKSSIHLTPITHIYINPLKPFEIRFPENIHTCLTCLLVYEDFLMQATSVPGETPLHVGDIYTWESSYYNTPDFTNVLEQMKWSARNGILPLFYYSCKFTELYAIILKNRDYGSCFNHNRRYHLTWENEKKLHHIKDILDSDILNPPSVNSLAMSAALSVSKLQRCFKQYYSMTITEYIHREKMKKAMLLLADDELNIKNIVHLCGYESASKFTCAFKKAFGMTPSQYRKAHNL